MEHGKGCLIVPDFVTASVVNANTNRKATETQALIENSLNRNQELALNERPFFLQPVSKFSFSYADNKRIPLEGIYYLDHPRLRVAYMGDRIYLFFVRKMANGPSAGVVEIDIASGTARFLADSPSANMGQHQAMGIGNNLYCAMRSNTGYATIARYDFENDMWTIIFSQEVAGLQTFFSDGERIYVLAYVQPTSFVYVFDFETNTIIDTNLRYTRNQAYSFNNMEYEYLCDGTVVVTGMQYHSYDSNAQTKYHQDIFHFNFSAKLFALAGTMQLGYYQSIHPKLLANKSRTNIVTSYRNKLNANTNTYHRMVFYLNNGFSFTTFNPSTDAGNWGNLASLQPIRIEDTVYFRPEYSGNGLTLSSGVDCGFGFYFMAFAELDTMFFKKGMKIRGWNARFLFTRDEIRVVSSNSYFSDLFIIPEDGYYAINTDYLQSITS